MKRLRIFGERRSPLEISRRRDSPRVQVLDSSIVIVVASRREMYMYSKKKKSALFYTRRKVAWHSLNHHHKVGDRRTLGESERARFESAPQSGRNPDDDGNPPPERALVSLTESGRERGGSAARGSDCRGLKGPFIASFGSTTHEHEEETNGKQSLCTKAQQP